MENEYQKRTDRLTLMKGEGKNPYPHKFDINTTFEEIKNLCSEQENNKWSDKEIKFASRVMQTRGSGKLVFYTLNNEGNKIQVMCKLDMSNMEKNVFKSHHKEINRGDIVGVIGYCGKSMSGEDSIYATNIQVLTPCLHALPSEHVGVNNVDLRYSKRYFDGIMNRKFIDVMKARSQIVSCIRNYLLRNNFTEVTTPILWNQAGGANAKPFLSHHNAMDMEVYLRVAPELFLKEMIVAGLNRVFEIGKQFRNEEIDTTHNPEFETLEFYQAYADYNDLIIHAETMLPEIVQTVCGNYKFQFHSSNSENDIIEIDFTPPFKKIDIMTTLEEEVGEKIDLSSPDLDKILLDLLNKFNIKCDIKTIPKMLDKLIGKFIEPKCINPTFLMNHPKIMSPLAKWHRDNSLLTERFELFVAGTEICNAYTELNDPIVQTNAFKSQEADQGKDDEAMTTNKGFIEALEYGLPPTGGFGLGIDRLVQFLTDNWRIQEVISFPLRKIATKVDMVNIVDNNP